MNPAWLFAHLLPTLGFILAVALLAHVLRERRSPAATTAWLLVIVLVPYLGVPAYLVLGGRKLRRMIRAKGLLEKTPRTEPAHPPPAELLIPASAHGGFAPATGNHLTLLTRGDGAFEQAKALIDAANDHVYVATFILGRDASGDALVEALTKKAAAGVTVRLLLDALGCVHINRAALADFHRAGGRSARFMPMLHLPLRGRANLRNHRKMILVDGREGMIGGMNLAAEYMGPAGDKNYWQDLSAAVTGPVVAQLETVFRSDWKFAHGETLPLPVAAPGDGPTLLQLVASGPDVAGDTIHDAVLTALCKTTRRLWIVTPYFVPDEPLAEALCLAARRGIDIRIILPRHSNHRLADLARESYLTQLQESGATVLLYSERMLHAKAVLVDDRIAMVGSANMDMRSLLLNYELALCIYDSPIAAQLAQWAESLAATCTTRDRRRRADRELLDGVGRLFAPLL